jgi:hypothetical protein
MILPRRDAFPSFGAWLDEYTRVLEQEDDQNRKKGQPVALLANEKLILKSPDGAKWQITVSNAGALSAVAV